jgi:hypothetical protein
MIAVEAALDILKAMGAQEPWNAQGKMATVNETFGTLGRLALYVPPPTVPARRPAFFACYLSAFLRPRTYAWDDRFLDFDEKGSPIA